MIYTVGDEVRCVFNGKFGIIRGVDEENETYTVDFDGVDFTMTEDDFC